MFWLILRYKTQLKLNLKLNLIKNGIFCRGKVKTFIEKLNAHFFRLNVETNYELQGLNDTVIIESAKQHPRQFIFRIYHNPISCGFCTEPVSNVTKFTSN